MWDVSGITHALKLLGISAGAERGWLSTTCAPAAEQLSSSLARGSQPGALKTRLSYGHFAVLVELSVPSRGC